MKHEDSVEVKNGYKCKCELVWIKVNQKDWREADKKKIGNEEKKINCQTSVGSQCLQCLWWTACCHGYLSVVRSLHDWRVKEPGRHRQHRYPQLQSGRLHLRRNAGTPWNTTPPGWPRETARERKIIHVCFYKRASCSACTARFFRFPARMFQTWK